MKIPPFGWAEFLEEEGGTTGGMEKESETETEKEIERRKEKEKEKRIPSL